MTTTADPDADIDIGELVETNNEERFVNLYRGGLEKVKIQMSVLFPTLNLRISGWVRDKGCPFTLIRPFPCCSVYQRASSPKYHHNMLSMVILVAPYSGPRPWLYSSVSMLFHKSPNKKDKVYLSSSCRSIAHSVL